MQSAQPSRFKTFLQTWLITTLAVLVAVYVVPGIRFQDNNLLTPFVASLILGILNAFLRPVLMLLALPLLVFTLGLFTLVVNAFLLLVVGALLRPHFEVDSFRSAFFGALIISVVSLMLNTLTGVERSRVQIQRRRNPRNPDPGGGNGPVIDI